MLLRQLQRVAADVAHLTAPANGRVQLCGLPPWLGQGFSSAACPPGSEAARSTIFALSSAAGRAAVAVVRLSGPAADLALQQLLPAGRALPPPRRASLATLRHPATRAPLDTALVLRFPGPASATGEACAELHLHGGPAVVRAVLDALCALPALRPAEPGEFSRRAFEAGRLDLTQVEGLADLLAAETEAQRLQALAASAGAPRRLLEGWRATLLTCLARVEAVIDFGEEEGIADDVAAGVAPLAAGLEADLRAHLAAAPAGELIRGGVRVALVGAPNAGKSSLLNALAGREAAIVSAAPGTTRDAIEVALDLGGYKVVLTDTAGLRRAADGVEAEGVRRAERAARDAHVLLHVEDAAAAAPGDRGGSGQTAGAGTSGGAWEESGGPAAEASWQALAAAHPGKPLLRVRNKSDLLPLARQRLEQGQGQESGNRGSASTSASGSGSGSTTGGREAPPCWSVSCLTGAGLGAVTDGLAAAVAAAVAGSAPADAAGAVVVTRARHRGHLGAAAAALARYRDAVQQGQGPPRYEIAAEELRAAARALGAVTGALDTEAVLDGLFAEFCCGK